MPKCGDKGSLTWEVEAPLIGKQGIVMIIRKPDQRISATHTFKVGATKQQEIRWPDQGDPDNPGKYFGGRMVDFLGLNSKTYKDRMADQKYFLDFKVGGKSKRSGDTSIDGYPDKGPVQIREGVPYETTRLDQRPGWFRKTFKIPKSFTLPMGTKFPNCGIYQVELKDGVVWLIIKAHFRSSTTWPPTSTKMGVSIADDIKNIATEFWNGPQGFGGWVYHRKDCVRKRHCLCPVTMSIASQKFLTGCCKIPIRMRFEPGNDIEVRVVDRDTWMNDQIAQGKKYITLSHTSQFAYPEAEHDTFAHETGHFIGFPDQYPKGMGGVVATNSALWPVDEKSIMGSGTGSAKFSRKVHLVHFLNKVKGMLGEEVEVMRV